MESLLLDIDNLNRNEPLYIFLQERGIPAGHGYKGVVVLIPKRIKLKAEESEHRYTFINSDIFISSITNVSFFICDYDYSSCTVFGDTISKDVLKHTVTYLPNNMKLVTHVNPNDLKTTKNVIGLGFVNPELVGKDQLRLSRLNDLIPVHDTDQVYNKTRFMLKNNQQSGEISHMNIRLDDSLIEYMRTITGRRRTSNKDSTISQKEIGGQLKVVRVTSDLDHVLGIDIDSIKDGGEESVHVPNGLFTFHTHPSEAYTRNKVMKGWPSKSDYLAFYDTTDESNAIMHIVVSVEGYYVMSRTKESYIAKIKLDSDLIKFINNSYILDKNKYSISEYVTYINKLLYKNTQLISLEFTQWNAFKSTRKHKCFYVTK